MVTNGSVETSYARPSSGLSWCINTEDVYNGLYLLGYWRGPDYATPKDAPLAQGIFGMEGH